MYCVSVIICIAMPPEEEWATATKDLCVSLDVNRVARIKTAVTQSLVISLAQTYWWTLITNQNPDQYGLVYWQMLLCHYLCSLLTCGHWICITGACHMCAPTDRFTSGLTYISRLQGLWCESQNQFSTTVLWAVRLSWLESAYPCALLEFFGILTSEVGQTDLVFGVPPGFISGLVHARLHTSLCVQQLRFVPHWLTSRQADREYMTSVDDKLSQLS